MNFSDFQKLDVDDLKIPNFAKGTQTPLMNQAIYDEAKRYKEECERKRQFRHDWLIASFSAISGAIFGFLSSLIFWLIEK